MYREYSIDTILCFFFVAALLSGGQGLSADTRFNNAFTFFG